MKRITISELIRMNGLPVWCVDGEGHQCYCLVNTDTEECIDKECGIWCFAFYDMRGDGMFGLHKMGWVAFEEKPKAEDK